MKIKGSGKIVGGLALAASFALTGVVGVAQQQQGATAGDAPSARGVRRAAGSAAAAAGAGASARSAGAWPSGST
jgi:type IV secretory pathway TrbL component